MIIIRINILSNIYTLALNPLIVNKNLFLLCFDKNIR